MSTFQQYQDSFTGHIRNPRTNGRPAGVPVRGMKIYTEIVFNNMESTLAACFPVCKKIVGVRRWQRMVRAFLAEHRCVTPWFRQIPEELLRWLETKPASVADFPPFFESLAHYEWIELMVTVADVQTEPADPQGDLLTGRPVLAAALALLEYPYPVHHLSPRFKPLHPDVEPTRLLVFRGADDEVRFVEINAVTARLMQLLQGETASGRAALECIARELRHPDSSAVLDFGATLLTELQQQGAILGTAL